MDFALPPQLFVVGFSEGLVTFVRRSSIICSVSSRHHQSLRQNLFMRTFWRISCFMTGGCRRRMTWFYVCLILLVLLRGHGRIFSLQKRCQLMQSEMHRHIFFNCEPDISLRWRWTCSDEVARRVAKLMITQVFVTYRLQTFFDTRKATSHSFYSQMWIIRNTLW